MLVEIHDLTARLEAERAMREREEHLRLSQLIAGLGSWRARPETGELAWSEGMYRLLGLDPASEPPDGDRFLEQYVHPAAAAEVRSRLETVLTGRRPASPLQFRVRRADGAEEIVGVTRTSPSGGSWSGSSFSATRRAAWRTAPACARPSEA